MAFDCVLKNHVGKIVLDTSHKECITVGMTNAETMPLRWSLQLARQLSIEKVVVQSDALIAVDCINFLAPNVNLNFLSSDCRQFLASFRIGSIMFLSRVCNLDVHNLLGLRKLYGSKT